MNLHVVQGSEGDGATPVGPTPPPPPESLRQDAAQPEPEHPAVQPEPEEPEERPDYDDAGRLRPDEADAAVEEMALGVAKSLVCGFHRWTVGHGRRGLTKGQAVWMTRHFLPACRVYARRAVHFSPRTMAINGLLTMFPLAGRNAPEKDFHPPTCDELENEIDDKLGQDGPPR